MNPFLLLLPLLAAPQEPATGQQLEAEWQALESMEVGEEVIYLFRGIHSQLFEPATPGVKERVLANELRARTLELRLDKRGYRALSGDREAIASLAEHPPEPAPAPAGPLVALWTGRFMQTLGLPEQSVSLLRSVVLTGEVEITTPELRLRCAQLSYQVAEGWTRLDQADLMLPSSYGPNGWPMRILALEISEFPDGSLEARQATLSTCDADQPHYALEVASLRGELGAEGYVWDPEDGWLSIAGHRLTPLPTPGFGGSEGDGLLSLRGLTLGSNKRDGQSVELDLRGAQRLDEDTRASWRFLPGFRTRRGLPLEAEFGLTTPGYRGDWDLFFLEDGGPDQHRYSRSVIRDDDTRYRGRLWNRFGLGESWRLDLDLAFTSDPLVDPEYFEQRWREQDDALSEVYLRYDGGSSFFDARAEARLDEVGYVPIEGFGPAGGPAPLFVESLPVLRWQAYPSTLTSFPAGFLGGADGELPVNLSYGAELGRFRLQDRELLTPAGVPAFQPSSTVSRDRLRAWTEVSVPVHLGGVFLRPGARFQGIAYDADLADQESADRSLAEGFVEVGALLLKDWDHGWQHRVLPQARFRKLSVQGDPPGRLAQFDEWDGYRSGEVLEFALRQQWIAPGGGLWADVELLLPYYTDRDEPLLDPIFPMRRPGEAPSAWGPAELRATWTPGVYGPTLEGVRVETRLRQDLHTAQMVEQFVRLAATPHERVEYGLAFRKVDGLVSQVEGTIDWRVSSDWGMRMRQPYNFQPGASKRSELALRRYGHDFVFEVGIQRDQATGESGVFFQLMPRFLVDKPPRPVEPRM
ncbi:MAG: hypothetical protein H8E31_11420 [Planctomycetes bacterium]|nr:hypothetical protein [Planctomycetota bacterium]